MTANMGQHFLRGACAAGEPRHSTPGLTGTASARVAIKLKVSLNRARRETTGADERPVQAERACEPAAKGGNCSRFPAKFLTRLLPGPLAGELSAARLIASVSSAMHVTSDVPPAGLLVTWRVLDDTRVAAARSSPFQVGWLSEASRIGCASSTHQAATCAGMGDADVLSRAALERAVLCPRAVPPRTPIDARARQRVYGRGRAPDTRRGRTGACAVRTSGF